LRKAIIRSLKVCYEILRNFLLKTFANECGKYGSLFQ